MIRHKATVTPAEAQAIQDDAVWRGDWLLWFVGLENGRAVATARRADPSGGTILGQLVARGRTAFATPAD